MTKKLTVVVLERTSVYPCFSRVVGVVVVLGPELGTVKVLGTFTSKNLLVKSEPLTVLTLGTRPKEITGTVAPIFYLSFKYFIYVTTFNDVTLLS